jgi:hypothetical protein
LIAGVLFSHAFSGELKAMSIMNEAVQDRVAEGGVAEHLRMPSFSIGWCLRSRLRTRSIRCLVKGLRLPTSVLDAAPLSWSSGCPMGVNARSG